MKPITITQYYCTFLLLALPTSSLFHHAEAFSTSFHNRIIVVGSQRQTRRSTTIRSTISESSSSSIVLSSSSIRSRKFQLLTPIHASQNDNDENETINTDTDAAKLLLEKAAKLRQEVSSLENTKYESQQLALQEKEALRQQQKEEEVRKENARRRYSAEVPILKDMGEEVMERVDFPPRLKGGAC